MIRQLTRPLLRPLLRPLVGKGGCERWVYDFDGVDDYGVFAEPIQFAEGEHFSCKFNVSTLSSNPALFGRRFENEFHSRVSILPDGGFNIRPTTSQSADHTFVSAGGLVQVGQTHEYKQTRTGTLYEFFLDGVKIGELVSGSAPGIVSHIGVSGPMTNLMTGSIYNIRINGQLYPINNPNSNIQLAEPSGLGAELITQQVLENPAVWGSQWTYLGAGRWQYVGDSTLNVLKFLANAQHPLQGFLEFEVESISGLMTCSQGGGIPEGYFSRAGTFRYFYTNINNTEANGATVEFKRRPGSVASCIIKNISFRPLGTANPLTLFNTNQQRWSKIPC